MILIEKYKKKIKNGFSYLVINVLRKVRIVRGLPTVHVIGDSHSLLFNDPLFQIHYVGPATAYNLISNSSTNHSKQKIYEILKKLPKNKKNILLFVFGEIDCRIHIYKISKERKVSLKNVIRDTATTYINNIKDFNKKFNHIQVVIFNVLPQGEQANYYQVKYYSSRKTRMMITRELNILLEKFCKKNTIPFIKVFDKLVDSKDERKKEFIFDEVHFNSKIIPFIINEMKDKKVIF